jgi:geranylgeranylglycerol-phosphate geranylgeranyltransferase
VISDSIQLDVLLLAVLAFLSNTGREICKGIVDIKGDRIKDVRTLAVRYGRKRASIAASIFFFLSVLLSPLPWILYPVSFWFFLFVFITDFGLVMSSIMLLRDSSRENARRVKNLVLLSFMFGLLAFIIGGLG